MQYVLPVDPQLLAPVRTDCASRRPQVEQSFTENTTDDDNENPPVTRTTHFFPTFEEQFKKHWSWDEKKFLDS